MRSRRMTLVIRWSGTIVRQQGSADQYTPLPNSRTQCSVRSRPARRCWFNRRWTRTRRRRGCLRRDRCPACAGDHQGSTPRQEDRDLERTAQSSTVPLTATAPAMPTPSRPAPRRSRRRSRRPPLTTTAGSRRSAWRIRPAAAPVIKAGPPPRSRSRLRRRRSASKVPSTSPARFTENAGHPAAAWQDSTGCAAHRSEHWQTVVRDRRATGFRARPN